MALDRLTHAVGGQITSNKLMCKRDISNDKIQRQKAKHLRSCSVATCSGVSAGLFSTYKQSNAFLGRSITECANKGQIRLVRLVGRRGRCWKRLPYLGNSSNRGATPHPERHGRHNWLQGILGQNGLPGSPSRRNRTHTWSTALFATLSGAVPVGVARRCI